MDPVSKHNQGSRNLLSLVDNDENKGINNSSFSTAIQAELQLMMNIVLSEDINEKQMNELIIKGEKVGLCQSDM